ncbi:M56 family metallopeptidase [Psychroserpens sp. SPM9]|uniref:M56 family metallopeptidase n=1 Tax=Psychroserpens sp. SPM9 TaxID=2975598 RepID=UPI0021A60AF4|nr:M56 family metallopeptidase [Psychroserpens sp. SPM9]MDG5492589.1 M56 family metallopeptidase [Psychroserpens sp. SPM9]
MDYLLKASAVLLIFYICYQIFLQRDTFFQANRWFLLSGLIIACSVPLVVIPIYIEYTPVEPSGYTFAVNEIALPASTTIEAQPFDYSQLILWTYFLGIFVCFGKLCIDFLSLRKVFKNSNLVQSKSFKILETSEHVAPFSFFNRIVYNPKQFKNEEIEHVINHEKVHTKELHSIDTILAQLACILFWFNPIVWLYKKALQQNLEFIADQKAQYVSPCEKSYQTVLLKASVKNHQLAFTNNFYTSLIKKRIVMLHKSKSNKLNQLKLLFVLPLLAVFMMSFNTKDVYVERASEAHIDPIILEVPQTENIEIVITKDTTDEELKVLQEKLKSKGITFTYKNVKRNSKNEITSIETDFKNANHSSNYNISSDDGIKPFKFESSDDRFSIGTISDEKNTFTFETNDGKKVNVQSTGSNVYVLKDEDSDVEIESDEHNATVVHSVKTWTDKNGEKISINASENSNQNVIITSTEEPLFIIDGKVVKKSLFEDVDSDEIHSVNVLKGKTALESFGDKGKNGVVIMTKKGSNNLFVNEDSDSNVRFSFRDNDGKQPLFIINGKEASEDQIRALDPNYIMSIDVLKDENAVKAYGKKGKNGVIVIRSKSGAIFSKHNKPRVIEVEEDGPWKIQTAVSSAYFIDDSGSIDTIEFVITKEASDAFLDKQKNDLKAQGIDAKFSKVRRNKAGEITSIKITLDDNQGRKSSASWKEKEQAIPDIVMGKSKNDKLFIRAIGH